MAFNPGATKRQKEAARRDKQRRKDEKKEQRKREKVERGPLAPGEDPDIAGIVPGPQPPLED
ncbi:SRp25 nuclear protein, isoform 3 [Anaeromyxobacter sp. Fw109-5]|uniref:SRp25 nuclear protein, isoform 3 n=1 Tax=Anaeromyxobacter sp. (strain Fw109-5) TaxID=404589 RepID=UPI000158A47D|nr:SRp25 nuclear protein, isoform 3 [Anaeromyxobacter sp. Fw109-5]ABS26696.1 conserved hypothetical protein [Anaeromyxobacter sp. Fw109-5]